jgi:hypothetical protein
MDSSIPDGTGSFDTESQRQAQTSAVPKSPDNRLLQDELSPQSVEADWQSVQRSYSFWAIIFGLSVTLLLVALENSVITTAAPAILEVIPLGDDWVWLTNSFFLASAAFQPLFGQLANLFGRRRLSLCVIAIFMLGSGICGGATNGATLIAGRTVQGIGSGGVTMAYGRHAKSRCSLRELLLEGSALHYKSANMNSKYRNHHIRPDTASLSGQLHCYHFTCVQHRHHHGSLHRRHHIRTILLALGLLH